MQYERINPSTMPTARNVEARPQAEFTVGRGGIKLPLIDTHAINENWYRTGIGDYFREFWRLNNVAARPLIPEVRSNTPRIRELVVPGDSENPTMLVRTVEDTPRHAAKRQFYDRGAITPQESTHTQVLQFPRTTADQPEELLRVDITADALPWIYEIREERHEYPEVAFNGEPAKPYYTKGSEDTRLHAVREFVRILSPNPTTS